MWGSVPKQWDAADSVGQVLKWWDAADLVGQLLSRDAGMLQGVPRQEFICSDKSAGERYNVINLCYKCRGMCCMEEKKINLLNFAKDAAYSLSEEAGRDPERKKPEKHTIVQPAGTRIRILLPDGYRKQRPGNPLQGAVRNITNPAVPYCKTTESSDNQVLIFRTTREKAMNPEDVPGLIEGIHRSMSEDQGLIEVRNGVTKRGYLFIYSIVKTISPEGFGGVSYFLRLNLFREEDTAEIQAGFKEIGLTGRREAVCIELARREGLMDSFASGSKGWAQDPYDPEYTRGRLMNLAEKAGLDGLFPEHPLSQARELLLAVLRDERIAGEDETAEPPEMSSEEDVSAGDEVESEAEETDFHDGGEEYEIAPEDADVCADGETADGMSEPDAVEEVVGGRAELDIVEEMAGGMPGADAGEVTTGRRAEPDAEEETAGGMPGAYAGEVTAGRRAEPDAVEEMAGGMPGANAGEETEDADNSPDGDEGSLLSLFTDEYKRRTIPVEVEKPRPEKKTRERRGWFGLPGKGIAAGKGISAGMGTAAGKGTAAGMGTVAGKAATAGGRKDALGKAAETGRMPDAAAAVYTALNDPAIRLFRIRERSVDLLGHVEDLLLSIGERSEELDAAISRIRMRSAAFRVSLETMEEQQEGAYSAAAGRKPEKAREGSSPDAGISGMNWEERTARQTALLQRTDESRNRVSEEYTQAIRYFGAHFPLMPGDGRSALRALAEDVKILADLLTEEDG